MTAVEMFEEAVENCATMGKVILRPSTHEHGKLIELLEQECTSSTLRERERVFQGFEGSRPWTIIVEMPGPKLVIFKASRT